MEYTIDRSSYRRSNRGVDEVKDNKKLESHKITVKTIFYNEIIVAMSILIGVMLIKILDLKNSEMWIYQEINTGIPFEILSQKVEKTYDKIGNELSNFISLEEKTEDVVESDNNNEVQEMITPPPQALETAVEGINQLSDDAQIIKQNYSFIRPISGGTVTSRFGTRSDSNPIVSSYHTGLDIAANTGTTIVAAHDGVVTNAGWISGYR